MATVGFQVHLFYLSLTLRTFFPILFDTLVATDIDVIAGKNVHHLCKNILCKL